jgi:hypothetical protein
VLVPKEEKPVKKGAESAVWKPAEGKLEAFLGEPKIGIEQIFRDQHAPKVVVTPAGTVLAFFRYPKEVKVRRSEDGGDT